MPNGINISKNEPVSALRTEIWNNYLTEYGNASFNLRAVNIEHREYVNMEPEKKINAQLICILCEAWADAKHPYFVRGPIFL
ncbi:393_t:CDS:2 [Diversispora eburnea]|uniref:393_t:CDS:1 n=1 Tax=Diversispora eburnea TaxID=1213867 RepID=A0A9N9ACD9_9GLOM|nr:393_t:CDS:2 [Diversispora eburnea]